MWNNKPWCMGTDFLGLRLIWNSWSVKVDAIWNVSACMLWFLILSKYIWVYKYLVFVVIFGPILKLISFLGTNSQTATTNIPNPSCMGIEFTGLRPAFFEESSCQQSFLTLALLEFPAIFFDQACLKPLSDISQ